MFLPLGVLQQQVGGGLHEYATIAAAESSGDPWVDGEEIIITGLGDLVMIYYTALEVDGHSGLIHAFPFGDATTHSAASVMFSEAEGVDPDSWSGFSDTAPAGTKPTDYDYDVDGGLARMRNITSSGRFRIEATAPTSAQTFTFAVIDQLSASTELASGIANSMFVTAYDDGTNKHYVNFRVAKDLNATTYTIGTDVDTGIAFGSANRIWIYVDDTTVAMWSDTSASPVTTTPSNSSGPNGLRFVDGNASGGENTTIKCGYFVNASLTAA
jgi:hypothetical protein